MVLNAGYTPARWETCVRPLGLGRSPEGGHGNPLHYTCLENPQGRRSLVGYSPWSREELDMTEQLSIAYTLQSSGELFKNISVTQSCLTLRPHGLQHTRLLCPSLTPRACSNSCPSSQWCHPTISSSVIPLSSILQSFPTSGSFPRSQFFKPGGQVIGASASALPFQWIFRTDFLYDGLAGSLCSPRNSQESSLTPQF